MTWFTVRLPRMAVVCIAILIPSAAAAAAIGDETRDPESIARDVLAPYTGPSVEGVDTSTLSKKVMCGYQGWFNCPGDGADLGWVHWGGGRRRPFGPGSVTVDLWPDVSDLDDDELFETGFKHGDGSTAKVFSSYNRKTVLRHFEWMRDYGIDGVFVQRFANGLTNGSYRHHKDVVLANCREGANRTGRAYAVMYDLSGLRKGGTRHVRDDWTMLCEKMNVTDDPAYLHHEGGPVVAVWGIGFMDGGKPRDYTLDECKELVAFLKDEGCTVMLGVPTGWRTLSRDSDDDPKLHEIIEMADIVSPWTVGRYNSPDGAVRHAREFWKPDVEWCREHSVDYLPVVFPGFSWHNLKGDRLNAIPRLKGKFFWWQVLGAQWAGADMIYVAMFDEVDEGTAIFKVSGDPPTGDNVTFSDNEGVPSDHYLHLTGHAGKLLRGEISPDSSPR